MSQIEQHFRKFLLKHPEIAKCYNANLINRRALARHLIKNGVADAGQIEATVAMLRRYDFDEHDREDFSLFKEMKTSIKDSIVILTYSKELRVQDNLQNVITAIDFQASETLKVIFGTANITIITDMSKSQAVQELIGSNPEYIRQDISQLSMIFPSVASDTKGILSAVSQALFLQDIVIKEFLTSSSELLIYIEEPYALKAYETIKRLRA